MSIRSGVQSERAAGDLARDKYQPKKSPIIDVRDVPGVDCTGASDSSTALNNLTNVASRLNGKTLSTRGCPLLRADGWIIHGQQGFELDLGGSLGAGTTSAPSYTQSGTYVFGCAGSGPVIQVDRSQYVNIHGGQIDAFGAHGPCPLRTTGRSGSIQFTNSGSGGYTSTHNYVHDTWLMSNIGGNQVTNYYGVWIHGTPNQEEFRFHNVNVGCHKSIGSKGFYSDDTNADSTSWDGGGVASCYRGYQMDAGQLWLYQTNNAGNGAHSIFGAGGASIYENGGCVTDIVDDVFAEGSGTLIYNTHSGGTYCSHSIQHVTAGTWEPDPAVYFIEAPGGNQVLKNNLLGASLHNVTIGCTTCGGTFFGLPGGSIVDLGGNLIGNSVLTEQFFAGGEAYLFGDNSFFGLSGTAGLSTDFTLQSPVNNAVNSDWPSPVYSALAVTNATGSGYRHGFSWGVTSQNNHSNNAQATLAFGYLTETGSGIVGTPAIALGAPLSGIQTIAGPGAPTNVGVFNVGTAGRTTYTYKAIARAGYGNSASSAASTTTGNATLSGTIDSQGRRVSGNCNYIQFTDPSSSNGAWGYDLYRTVGGPTQGKITTVFAPLAKMNWAWTAGGLDAYIAYDCGQAGDGTIPPAGYTDNGSINIPSGATYQVKGAQINSTNLSDGHFTQVYKASLITTSETADNVSITGITASSHCSLTATNASAAINFASTYVSAKAKNQITVAHTGTSGMTYDILCTAN